MRFNDAIFGAVLILFAVAEIAYTRTFPSLHGQSYGPDLFPVLIGVALIICGSLLIVRGLKTKQIVPWVTLGDWAGDRKTVVNVLLVLLSLLLYILASDWAGFFPLSFIILSVLLYRLGSSLVVSILVALAATVVIQLLFARLLLVPLPRGLLQSFNW